MPNPSDRPERQSRARSSLADHAAAGGPAADTPEVDDGHVIDLDRLRASMTSLLADESAARPARSAATQRAARPAPAERLAPAERPAPSAARERPVEPTAPGSGRWKIAVPIAVAALGAVGFVALNGGSDQADAASEPTATTARPATGAAATPTSADAATTTATPTTAAPAAAAAPVAAAAAAASAADPAAPPPHKATYRAGKLYLEGRVASTEEAQKYIAKAAAVLGPDNVVDNYTIDPTVPLSNDGTVYVDEPFLFETGSSDLNPQYTGVLGLGIAALKLSPSARMVVTGYTDSKGDPAANQQLSEARANAVVDYMVTTGGIDRARFDAIGAGDRNPVGDNATEEGRALNRRIDVKFVNLLG